jgi:hypothetical protein
MHPMRALLAAALCVLVGGLLTSCAARPHTPRPDVPPPPPPPVVAADDLQIALLWSAPVDLDLYVTDPAAVTVYFANSPIPSGGRLLTDVRCADRPMDEPRVEVAGFTDPPAGTYRVGVDFSDRCGAPAAPVAYRVVVDVGGRRHERTGTIDFERFQPIVLEFGVNP